MKLRSSFAGSLFAWKEEKGRKERKWNRGKGNERKEALKGTEMGGKWRRGKMRDGKKKG